jgi:hypothetical protein
VPGDPLADLSALRDLRLVMQAGSVYASGAVRELDAAVS